jgi:hypothetical protein
MELSQEYNNRLKAALDEVVHAYSKLSPEAVQAKIEAHKQGDIALALQAAGVFNGGEVQTYLTESKFVGHLLTKWNIIPDSDSWDYSQAIAA